MLGQSAQARGGAAVLLSEAEGRGEDGVEGAVGDVVVGREGAAAGLGAFELPYFDDGGDRVVHVGSADLVDEGGRHEVVYEVAVLLEEGGVGFVPGVLLGHDAAEDLAEEAAPVEFFRAPNEDVVAFEGVRYYHPWV